MSRKKIAITVLLLVFCFTNLSADLQPKQVTCTGKVLDDQGRPVAGAKITAYEMIFDGIAGNFNLHKAGEVISTKDGAFVFTGGQKPERSTFHECKIVAVKSGMALGSTVWKMREDATSDIRLGSPEKLEGVIVDDYGKPVAGADVRANLSLTVRTAEGEEKREWLPGIKPLDELGAKTDSKGRFFFGNLPADAGVDLLIMAPDKAIIYTYQSAKKQPAFKAGQTDIKITLPAEARIEGQIIDPDTGKGVAGTKFAVVATSSGLFYYRFVHTTNDDGTFSVGGLQTDKYLLRNGGFPSNTYVEAESGKMKKIMVMADRLSRPGGITGVVRDPEGRPLAGAVVSTYPPVTEQFITKAGGEFTLKSKRAPRQSEDTIYIFVRHMQRNLAVAEVLDESAKEYDVTVTPAATLSGKVVDVDGKGIAGTKLSLVFWIGNRGYDFSDIFEVDNTGRYEIKTIPTGCTYSVTVMAEGYGRRSIRTYTGGAENQRVELEPMILSVANLSASGVVVDEFDQPVSEVSIMVSGDGQPRRQTLTDAKGEFTIENICPGRIRIYADKIRPQRLSGRIEAEAGQTDIRVVVAQEDSRGRRVPRKPPSRLGKPLPELTSLKIELSPADIDGKMILVYFWDMQQRPSRNTLLRLTKRAEELKQKGVLVVAVQAVKVDESTLKGWIKENNIPFPAGMARGDETKTRFNWGIRYLPWLILTDRSHVVVAEGFGLSKLDEMLEKIEKQ
ncbi:MAG TPA: hypothetical protein DIU00_10780 [Phycisphaerales bacterium]|nr:hypothetical protein [Phycisphaerales bacterium]